MTSPSVVFVVPDKLGGMVSLIDNLLRVRTPDAFSYAVVLTHNPLSADTRFGGEFPVDHQTTFEYRFPVENIHAVLRRLRSVLPAGDGVLVANDLVELALASAFDCGRTVIQILHGDTDYYYDLAARHEMVVDAFVTIGRTMDRKLRERLPHRDRDIYLLPYGIAAPARRRAASSGPLRLLFAGRLEHGQKGVLDLPRIDQLLVERGVDVSWTIVGSGPDESALRDAWTCRRVTFQGARTAADVLEIASRHDVFVLPTRHEGVPVALLEAMSVGLAPVVSRVESGVAEMLVEGSTALMPPVGDVEGFAEAITRLDRDRGLLESIGDAAACYVATAHDIYERSAAYQALFARYRELRRPRAPHVVLPYGSRLDRPWIPNMAVRTVRSMIRRAQGKPY
jgi:glycosyltransferase involved in cell wall biosynthesis